MVLSMDRKIESENRINAILRKIEQLLLIPITDLLVKQWIMFMIQIICTVCTSLSSICCNLLYTPQMRCNPSPNYIQLTQTIQIIVGIVCGHLHFFLVHFLLISKYVMQSMQSMDCNLCNLWVCISDCFYKLYNHCNVHLKDIQPYLNSFQWLFTVVISLSIIVQILVTVWCKTALTLMNVYQKLSKIKLFDHQWSSRTLKPKQLDCIGIKYASVHCYSIWYNFATIN